MAFLNDNYSKLKAGYLFPEIARRVKAFTDANPDVLFDCHTVNTLKFTSHWILTTYTSLLTIKITSRR